MDDTTITTYLPLWIFIALMVGTPGPANALMMAAGAQHGFRPLLRFLAGLVAGKLLLNLGWAFGLGTLLARAPAISSLLALAAGGYVIVLAAKGWNAPAAPGQSGNTPGFVAGLWVHPLNPKAWVMTTLANTQFAAHHDGLFATYALVPLSFLGAQLVFHTAWAMAGVLCRMALGPSRALNRTLIVLTVGVVIWALLQTPPPDTPEIP